MRFARRLSANSTHPSEKHFFLLPPDRTRRARSAVSSGGRYIRSTSVPYPESIVRSAVGLR